MLCEKCKKNQATTHIRSVVNGVVSEKNLCHSCAKEEGYNDIGHNSLASMLASMFGEVSSSGLISSATRCPICNSSFNDIAKTGKIGCAECYKTFNSELLPYLKRVHGSTKHVGKIPCRAPLMVRPEKETIADLRLELNRLISEENYEQAVVIRDKIRELEAQKDE